MSTVHYHNNVKNFQKSFEWRFWISVSFKVKLPSIKSYISNKLARLFKKLYLHFEDLSKDIDSYSPEESEKLFKDLQKLIPQLIKNHEKLDEIDFLDDYNLKSNLRKALDYSYVIEAKSKKIAKSMKKDLNSSDVDMKLALSHHSKKNLTSKIS